jgi:nicotinic acid mononucleotide adenylyltransferase
MEMDYDAPDSIRYLADAPTMSVSSTFIREKLSAGTDLRFLIPDASYAYAKRVLGFRH